jgi:methionyl-tRNA formyltransferase
MKKPLKIIFAGTPAFAVPTLEALVKSHYQVQAVLTQPDRPAGRGQHVTASPVKTFALNAGLMILQPEALRDPAIISQLQAYSPDLMIVVAYGLLLPQTVLDIPKYGCINVHASLLPRWRGAAPIQRAIAAGDALTGVSIMRMEAGLDTGPVYLRAVCPIDETITNTLLQEELAQLGATSLLEVLSGIENPNFLPVPQIESKVTYAKKISKAEGIIDWQMTAETIARLIRAFDPWPAMQSSLAGSMIKIRQAHVITQAHCAHPGTIISSEEDALWVACGHDVLAITQLQLPNRATQSFQQIRQAFASLFASGQSFQ